MDRYSILDQSSPVPSRHAVPRIEDPPIALPEDGQEHVRFPGEDGGKSLAETARGDLDAALQLLAERAKYITGALAATIGLYQDGELICHACTGLPQQKTGKLLQIGSGLASESARTRRILRCNDTSIDSRVNVETCQKFGISSAMVMPLVRGPHVIGIFELLSGHPNAFEERDLTALARLGEMVETAFEHSEEAQQAPQDTFFDEELPPVEVGVVLLKLDPEPVAYAASENALPSKSTEPPLLERGNIGSCQTCAFPISGRRRLCVDCEAVQPSDADTQMAEPAAPSFLSGPGKTGPAKPVRSRSRVYTLGALLIAVITTAAIVAWVQFPAFPAWIQQHVKLPH